MQGTQERISVKITRRREAVGLTIYKLAKLSGIKWETLRDIERGDTTPRQATVVRIERVLAQREALR